MTFIRSLSKFMQELFPLVLATVISAVLLSTLHLTSDTAQARRADAADPIVYVNAMPHINRDPAPTVVASLTPAAEAVMPARAATPAGTVQPSAADATIPIQPTPRQQATVPPARDRTARGTVAAHSIASPAPKAAPAVKVEPVVAKVEPAVAKLEPTSTFAPPMPIPPMSIINAEAQGAAPEPTRVFGMTVPASVVTVGGRVVGVARFPLEVAEVAVPHPLARMGLRIVERVAGAAGSAISDFGR